MFSKSHVFTKSSLFSKTKPFTNSRLFTSSKQFTKSKPFTKTAPFSNSQSFTSSEQLSAIETFQTNQFFSYNEFSGNPSHRSTFAFSKSEHFSQSTEFSQSFKFTESLGLNFTDQTGSQISTDEQSNEVSTSNTLFESFDSENDQNFSEKVEISLESSFSETESNFGFIQSSSFSVSKVLNDKSFTKTVYFNEFSTFEYDFSRTDNSTEKIVLPSSPEKKGGINIGIIVGVVCAVLAVAAVSTFVIIYMIKKKNVNVKFQETNETQSFNKSRSVPENLNPIPDDEDRDLNFWL